MTGTSPTDAAVASFIRTREARPAWRNVPPAHRPADIPAGYRMQRAVHERLQASGNRRAGYKIGSTSKPGQAIFGLEEPAYAGMFEDNRAPTLDAALRPDLISPAVECEVAVRLGHALDGRRTMPSQEETRAAIAECCLACEVIDRRYGDALALGLPTLLADDFFHSAFVLGPPNPRWRDLDLADLSAAIEIDGERFTGVSQDVLDPIAALQWLVSALARTDLALSAGDVVLTGSIVPPTPIRLPARSVRLTISGFEPMVAGAA